MAGLQVQLDRTGTILGTELDLTVGLPTEPMHLWQRPLRVARVRH
jgi:hypothetical protein